MNIQILDTETTGLDSSVDQLVELASINLHDDRHFTSLCNPGRAIPPEVKAIHHITEVEAFAYPTPQEVTDQWLHYLGDPEIIVAHNAKFDKGFMKPLLGDAHPLWICTYKCSVMAWPDAPKHSNQVLRYWLGLDPDPTLLQGLAPHRALYDIVVTRDIFRRLQHLHPIEKLLDWSSGPILLPKVTFGKHAGKTWDQVDKGYLRWCLGQHDMNEDVLHTARYWMDRSR